MALFGLNVTLAKDFCCINLLYGSKCVFLLDDVQVDPENCYLRANIATTRVTKITSSAGKTVHSPLFLREIVDVDRLHFDQLKLTNCFPFSHRGVF